VPFGARQEGIFRERYCHSKQQNIRWRPIQVWGASTGQTVQRARFSHTRFGQQIEISDRTRWRRQGKAKKPGRARSQVLDRPSSMGLRRRFEENEKQFWAGARTGAVAGGQRASSSACARWNRKTASRSTRQVAGAAARVPAGERKHFFFRAAEHRRMIALLTASTGILKTEPT